MKNFWYMVGFLAPVILLVAAFAAWFTHIYWAITTLMSEQAATTGQIVLSIIGTVAPPIGVIHGIILW